MNMDRFGGPEAWDAYTAAQDKAMAQTPCRDCDYCYVGTVSAGTGKRVECGWCSLTEDFIDADDLDKTMAGMGCI